MGTEDKIPRSKSNPEKSKKRKKPRKDKWGQPLATADEPAAEGAEPYQPPEEPAAAEEEKEKEAVGSLAGDQEQEEEEGYEASKVVASGLPYSTTEAAIRELFEQFGPIRSLQLSRFPDSGNFRGLAFVSFQSEEVAIKSLELDGFKIDNRFIKVERCRMTSSSKRKRKTEFQSDPEKADGCLSAYVGNLAWGVTEKDIRDCFKGSRVASVRFAFDKRTGTSRGFCHIDFQDDESLEKALQKNQFELHGRPMKIAYAVSSRS